MKSIFDMKETVELRLLDMFGKAPKMLYISSDIKDVVECGFSAGIDPLYSLGNKRVSVEITVRHAVLDNNDEDDGKFYGGVRTFDHSSDDYPQMLAVVFLWRRTLLVQSSQYFSTSRNKTLNSIKPIDGPKALVYYLRGKFLASLSPDVQEKIKHRASNDGCIKDFSYDINALTDQYGIDTPCIVLFEPCDYDEALRCIMNVLDNIASPMFVHTLPE